MARLLEESLSGISREPGGAHYVGENFNLHAGPRFDANDRKQLQRLCRFPAGRP